MQMSKFVLRKPITAVLIILSIVFFGLISFGIFKIELVPDINMPMYIVSTVYPGASPEDVDDIVTTKIEEQAYNLSGAKDITCVSRENVSLVVIQYDYGQNMDVAYNDLKKAVDKVKSDFPDSVQDSMIVEMDMNSRASMQIAVRNKSTSDIYNYVVNDFAKKIERLSDVASVDTSGGRENYIKIELSPESMMRYNLSMSTLKSIISAADFVYPAGTIDVGKRELSLSTEVQYKTIESLKTIPIITGNNRTLYLEDIATIYQTKKESSSFGRYDGADCMVVGINKAQRASSVALSREVKKTLKKIIAENPNIEATIVLDSADNINHSIENVFQTMIIAIVLSMIVIILFLGDVKGSIIIGTSIPFSILSALVCMYVSGYTLNLITLSALVLGVGMMVDNSIVVLEACFRAKENHPGNDVKDYIKSALEATETIGASVFGSTLTTVVVFGPLGFLSGMSGQFFKPLGFTIVFCMMASFVSALTIVPLTYVLLKPEEKDNSLASPIVERLQLSYRVIIKRFLRHSVLVTFISIVVLICSFALITTFKTELVSETDEGMISISITTKPSLNMEEKDKIYNYFEEYVKNQEDVENYLLAGSGSTLTMSGLGGGQSLIAYLKEDRKKSTKQLISEWKKDLTKVVDCTVSISNYSTSFTSAFAMPDSNGLDFYIESEDYDSLKQVNDQISKKLQNRADLSNVTTSLDNAAPVVKVKIDPILAAAEGFTPAQIGALLNYTVSGIELFDMKIDGENMTVMLEYKNGKYNSIEKIQSLEFISSSGNKATLKDIATITMEDSPASIRKYNKKYRSQIKADFNDNYVVGTNEEIMNTSVYPLFTQDVKQGISQVDEMLGEEFGGLFMAIGIAVFLVFVVMASQFESIRFSFMVMGTVLYSFAGAILGLWLGDLKLSMVSLLGFMMLTGTAVNNGILYVDTVNQMRDSGKELIPSLIDAGALRLRPILMTTLTTLVSMIPMSLAYGKNGEILQPLGVSDMGGLIISTLMALYILPVFYYMFSHSKNTSLENLAKETNVVIKNKEG